MKNKLGEPLMSHINHKQIECQVCGRKFFDKSPAYTEQDRHKWNIADQILLAHLVVCSKSHLRKEAAK